MGAEAQDHQQRGAEGSDTLTLCSLEGVLFSDCTGLPSIGRIRYVQTRETMGNH